MISKIENRPNGIVLSQVPRTEVRRLTASGTLGDARETFSVEFEMVLDEEELLLWVALCKRIEGRVQERMMSGEAF